MKKGKIRLDELLVESGYVTAEKSSKNNRKWKGKVEGLSQHLKPSTLVEKAFLSR